MSTVPWKWLAPLCLHSSEEQGAPHTVHTHRQGNREMGLYCRGNDSCKFRGSF